MKSHYRKSKTRGFTLTELLVVILIIAVLATLAFMGVSRLRDASRRAVSIGNLRQFGIALTTFTADNNDYLPVTRLGSTYWPQVIYPYVGNTAVFLRPGSKNVPVGPTQPEGYFAMDPTAAKTPEGMPIRWNYVINGGAAALPFSEDPKNNPRFTSGLARTMSTIEQPNRTVFMSEGKEAFWLNAEAKVDSVRIYRWKDGSSNVLFGDGSTRNLNVKRDLVNNQFTCKKS